MNGMEPTDEPIVTVMAEVAENLGHARCMASAPSASL